MVISNSSQSKSVRGWLWSKHVHVQSCGGCLCIIIGGRHLVHGSFIALWDGHSVTEKGKWKRVNVTVLKIAISSFIHPLLYDKEMMVVLAFCVMENH